jgi:lipopolysaccharide transport system ATP-binding protein
MSDVVIKVENLGKQYRLGDIGTGTFSNDFYRWFSRIIRKEDPNSKIGQVNDRTKKSSKHDIVWALKEVNFEVKRGEVLGIIGRNGAGKSTLLKILSRVTAPTIGEVKLKGKIASLLEVGTGFHPDLTGRENIYLNGAILGMTKREIKSKFDEIIQFSGVERYIDTPVKKYSSGMYVRLAFAVAAHLDPEILIVDEVLAVGDAEFQKKCLGKMKDVSGQGRTVLFVSHNMQAVSTLTSKCINLINGQINSQGETQSVINDYLMEGKSFVGIYLDNDLGDEPKVTRVQIFTSLPNNFHLNCEKMDVEIEIHIPKPLNGAAISFQIINEYDLAVVHCWNFDSDKSFAREPGCYLLKCSFPNLKLYLGKYCLTVHFGELGTGKKIQTIEKICSYEVVMFGKKRDYNWVRDACVYIEDNTWQVNKF